MSQSKLKIQMVAIISLDTAFLSLGLKRKPG